MKDIVKLPAEYYLRRITSNEPFSFSRFGDGEVLCMFHVNGFDANTDGSYFSNDLIEPMKQIFRNNYNYFHCLLRCSFDVQGDLFKKFLEDTCPDMLFYDGEFWQDLSFGERITEIIDAINVYKPCFVGGKHIANVKFLNHMSEMSFIETPCINAFQKIETIIDLINMQYKQGCRMFCFCAGFCTKIIIDRLFSFIGHDAFMLDFGSVFDPYCGRLSRSGMVSAGFRKFQKFTTCRLE